MELKLQIISLIFSTFYGIVFSICTNLNYRFLFSKNKVFKIVFTIIYIIDFSLLYFLLIKKINQGVIHEYFLLAIGVGYLISFVSFTKIVNNFKAKLKIKLKKVSSRQKKS